MRKDKHWKDWKKKLKSMSKEELTEKAKKVSIESRAITEELRKRGNKIKVERLLAMSDMLNDMFQDSAMEEICPDEANKLYTIMESVDRKVREFASDNEIKLEI